MSLEICFKYFFLTPLGQRAAPWLASQTRRWRYLEMVVGQEKRFSICFPLAVCAEAACHMSFSPISLHPFQNHYPYYFHLSLRATHTRPRHPAALASVRSGIVLVQVRVPAVRCPSSHLSLSRRGSDVYVSSVNISRTLTCYQIRNQGPSFLHSNLQATEVAFKPAAQGASESPNHQSI